MGWVSATQYEPEVWGKLPSVSDPIGGGFTVVLSDGGETEVVRSEAKAVEPKAVDTAPAVKRVAKKTTPKTKPKTKQADDKE